jgi:hypothetical protein
MIESMLCLIANLLLIILHIINTIRIIITIVTVDIIDSSPLHSMLTCSDDDPTTTIENTRSGTTPTPAPAPAPVLGSAVGIKKYENIDPPVSGIANAQLCVVIEDSKDVTSDRGAEEKNPFIANAFSFPIRAVRDSTLRPYVVENIPVPRHSRERDAESGPGSAVSAGESSVEGAERWRRSRGGEGGRERRRDRE